MNRLFFGLIFSGFLVTAWRQVSWVPVAMGESPLLNVRGC